MTFDPAPYADVIDMQLGKQRGSLYTKRDEINPAEILTKPNWIRDKTASPSGRFRETKDIVRTNKLVTVGEEASCLNIGEYWSEGTATFMIMEDKCTRRCRFCNVATGRSNPLDLNEPECLAQTIALMKLKYVVITSVDRDDLHDGGAAHFVERIRRIRAFTPDTDIEILTPDFGGRLDPALEILGTAPPDVLNHNIETVPRFYKEARPGAEFQNSLNLLQRFKAMHPKLPTKSGLMVGLGETDGEILQVLRDLRAHGVAMLTIGQLGFLHAASGPLVRS
jgi:lipoic acid synthetase